MRELGASDRPSPRRYTGAIEADASSAMQVLYSHLPPVLFRAVCFTLGFVAVLVAVVLGSKNAALSSSSSSESSSEDASIELYHMVTVHVKMNERLTFEVQV